MFDPSRLDLSGLPSVRFDRRRDLPSCQGIYFVTASDGAVLYIGKAKNICQRWVQHHRESGLKVRQAATIAWLAVDGGADLLSDAERACIEYFSPVLNGLRRGGYVDDREVVKCRIVLPAWVDRLIVEQAKGERRSVSAQILCDLEQLLGKQPATT